MASLTELQRFHGHVNKTVWKFGARKGQNGLTLGSFCSPDFWKHHSSKLPIRSLTPQFPVSRFRQESSPRRSRFPFRERGRFAKAWGERRREKLGGERKERKGNPSSLLGKEGHKERN